MSDLPQQRITNIPQSQTSKPNLIFVVRTTASNHVRTNEKHVRFSSQSSHVRTTGANFAMPEEDHLRTVSSALKFLFTILQAQNVKRML